MKTTITTFAAIAAACFAGTSAFAGPKSSKKVSPPAASESCISGEIGFDITTEYIRHGIVQQNQGFQIQPYADLHFRVYEGSGVVSSITADVGIWNHFESHHPGRVSTTPSWREFDFTFGVTAKVDKLSISPQFIVRESPADVAGNAYAFGLTLAYDDSEMLGDFALNPYIHAEFEGWIDSRGTIGNFANPRGTHQYVEIGIAPGHSYGDLTLTVPVSVGLGNRYYAGNKAFGFVSIGLDASYALTMVPECLGKWSVHAGFTYVHLGEGARLAAPGGDESRYIASGGLRVAF